MQIYRFMAAGALSLLFWVPAVTLADFSEKASICALKIQGRGFSSLYLEKQEDITAWADQKVREKVNAGDFSIDALEMVVPSPRVERTLKKISNSLSDFRKKLEAAKTAGKSVAFIHGHFDLVHKGHASFLLAAKSAFARAKGVEVEDVYLAVLADSDELMKLQNHSRLKNGGHEAPLQSGQGLKNSRFIDLASLGADLVGVLPSPGELERSGLLQDRKFRDFMGRRFERMKLDEMGAMNSNREKLSEKSIEFLKELSRRAGAVRGWVMSRGQIGTLVRKIEKGQKSDSKHPSAITPYYQMIYYYLTFGLRGGSSVARITGHSPVVSSFEDNWATAHIGLPVFELLSPQGQVTTEQLLWFNEIGALQEAKRRAHEAYQQIELNFDSVLF